MSFCYKKVIEYYRKRRSLSLYKRHKVVWCGVFFLGIVKGDQIFAIFSSPTWQKFYLENQCFDFDPVVRAAYAQNGLPLDWASVSVLFNPSLGLSY
jgi:hypothetical protein